MTSINQAPRYHALDSLRASMMMLGILLHASTSYVTIPLGDAWAFKDAHTSQFFDLLVCFIHSFRMPIFFVMAGFFAALLHERGGITALLSNRYKRIVVPFVLGWAVLYPLVRIGSLYGVTVMNNEPFSLDWAALYSEPTLVHLWFMYYLILFYGAAAVVTSSIGKWAKPVVAPLFRKLLESPLRLFYLAGCSFATLLLMASGTFDTPRTFVPDGPIFLAYSLFFTFGWLLFGQRDMLPLIQKRAWTHFLLAIVLLPLNLYFISKNLTALAAGQAEPSAHFFASLSTGLLVWLFVFGITGLFWRHLSEPSVRMRYLADSSFWLYLAHLPLTIWIPVWLAGVDMSAFGKVAIVLLVSLPLLLVSYHFLVRPTFIGAILNGRRYSIAKLSLPMPIELGDKMV